MSFPEKQEEITKVEWMQRLESMHIQRQDMNKLIMNYLVTEGFKEAAEKFQVEAGIRAGCDLDSLDSRIKIRDALLAGRVQEATELLNQLHPELLDNDRYLFFLMQQQQLIELIREGKVEEALKFAQDQLSERGEEDQSVLEEIERTLALLAFDQPQNSPFSDLLHPSHCQKVASEVNAAIIAQESRPGSSKCPQLGMLLKLILWAQDQLDKKKVKYPKMTDLATAAIKD